MEDLAKVYLKMMGISESLAMWSCEYNPVKDDEDEEVETNVPSMNLYQMHYSSIDDIEELLKKLEQEYAQAVRDTDIKIQARAAWAKRSAMFSVGALICYLVAGCTFFLSQTDWRLLDAMLFTVYTATSAGYGHLEIPATPLFHSFTMCFILFGGATLAVVVAQVYQYFAFESFRAEMYRKRSKLARDTLEKLSREASPEDRAKVKAVLTAHLKHWEKHLTSRSSSWKTFFRETKIGRVLSIVVPLSSTLLSGALIIGQIEGWAFIESLYFAVVSMAAVGYGDYVPSTDAGIVVTLIWLPCSFIFTSIYISTIVSCYFSTAKKTIREMEAAMRVEQQATSSIQNTTNNNHNLMQVELEFPCSDFRTHNIHSTRSTKKVACPTDQYHELSSPSIATAPTASTTTSSTFTANLDEAMMFISQNA